MKKKSLLIVSVICASLLSACGSKASKENEVLTEAPEVMSAQSVVEEAADEVVPYRAIKYNEKYTSKYFSGVDDAKSFLASVGVSEEFVKLINGNEVLNSADNIKLFKENNGSAYDEYNFLPLIDSKSKESVLLKCEGSVVITIDAKVTGTSENGTVQASAVFSKGSSSIQYIIDGIDDVKAGDIVQVTGVLKLETSEMKAISTYKY